MAEPNNGVWKKITVIVGGIISILVLLGLIGNYITSDLSKDIKQLQSNMHEVCDTKADKDILQMELKHMQEAQKDHEYRIRNLEHK